MAQVQNGQVILSSSEITGLEALRLNEARGEAYEYVARLLRSLEDGNESLPESYRSVMLWFEGAALVNLATHSGESAFADLIRFYSSRQTELHFGSAISPYGDAMQDASDGVARNAVSDILSNGGVIPSIESIANYDATAVGLELFNQDSLDTAFTRNAAWSGTILFPLLRSDQTGLLLQDRDNTAEDFNTLEDLRNLLFAVDSFNYGMQRAVAGFDFFSGDWRDIFPTGIETMLSTANPLELSLSFINGMSSGNYAEFLLSAISGGAAKTAMAFVVEQDRYQVVQGLSTLFGLSSEPVTEANFVNRANTVFASIETNNLLSLNITRIDSFSPNDLVAQAQNSIAYLYALVNLNAFVLEGDNSIYDRHNQNGELTIDNFSEQYLQDRANYLAHLLESKARDEVPETAIFDDSNGVDSYSDLSSGGGLTVHNLGGTPETNLILSEEGGTTNILGGTTDDERRFTTFGSDADEAINGNQNGDHLYGGEGNDTLTGGKGDDYLEGGTGNDTYRFEYGDGRDRIVDNGAIIDNNSLYLTHEDGGPQVQVGELTLVANSDTQLYVEVDSNGERLNNTTYLVLDTPTAENPNHQSLLITIDGGAGGTITIEGWGGTNNNFGISLNNAATVEEPNQDDPYTVTGDETTENPIPDDRDLILDVTQTLSYWPSYQYDGRDSSGNPWEGYTLRGGDNNDHLLGGRFADNLYGGAGDDIIETGGSDDVIPNDGATPANQAFGGLGSDYIIGGEGRDMLYGNTAYFATYDTASQNYTPPSELGYSPEAADSADYIDGGAGNDGISAGEGNDTALGGAGSDVIYGGDGADTLSGGEDSDLVLGDSHAARRHSFLNLFGVLINRAGANTDYDDVIDGGAGNDILAGEIGNDIISGGAQDDVIFGERWFAPYQVTNTLNSSDLNTLEWYTELPVELHGDDILYGGEGNDSLWGNGGQDTLLGGVGDDELFGDDFSLADEHHGADTLDGGAGADVIMGKGGDDTLRGGTGDDHLQGDSSIGVYIWRSAPGEEEDMAVAGEYHGNDLLDGGEGDDLLIGDGGDDVLLGGSGDDTLWGDSVYQILNVGFGPSFLPPYLDTKYHGNDTLAGGEGADHLYGGSGEDTLDGGADDDNLFGQAGNDTLIGGAGIDYLDGGDGDDSLQGGAGNDYLVGGEGEDNYHFNVGDGQDSIADSISVILKLLGIPVFIPAMGG